MVESVDELVRSLAAHSYLAGRPLATVVTVALSLQRPLLLEGEAGVGKTELAKTLADVLGARLIRLQCYEGIDVSHALYDWNYARQMLHIRTLEATHAANRRGTEELFAPEFLVRRPLLDAVDHHDPVPPVMLIDEIDRADDEFEAFLLELLSDFQVTIPEIGTIRASTPPSVILTSNRTRELHDALRRRCLYFWIDHPSVAQEAAIVRTRLPGVGERLAQQAAAFVASTRKLELVKAPGIAETLDWVQAIAMFASSEIDAQAAELTLGALVKHHEDLELVTRHGIDNLMETARAVTGG